MLYVLLTLVVLCCQHLVTNEFLFPYISTWISACALRVCSRYVKCCVMLQCISVEVFENSLQNVRYIRDSIGIAPSTVQMLKASTHRFGNQLLEFLIILITWVPRFCGVLNPQLQCIKIP